MIKSQLILDILDLGLEYEEETENLKKQIPFLTEKEYEYTGVGVHVYFKHDPKIIDFQTTLGYVGSILENGDKKYCLEGLEIRNDKEKILADGIIHLTNGYITGVEIWNKIGDYPREELVTYDIYQLWIDKEKRRIITRTKKY